MEAIKLSWQMWNDFLPMSYSFTSVSLQLHVTVHRSGITMLHKNVILRASRGQRNRKIQGASCRQSASILLLWSSITWQTMLQYSHQPGFTWIPLKMSHCFDSQLPRWSSVLSFETPAEAVIPRSYPSTGAEYPSWKPVAKLIRWLS